MSFSAVSIYIIACIPYWHHLLIVAMRGSKHNKVM